MQIEIAVIGALFGFLISYFSFMRSRDKEVKKEATHDAIIGEKRNNIGSGVDEIRIDMKANDKRLEKLSEQVIRVDESAKSAHKRLDKIDKECVK